MTDSDVNSNALIRKLRFKGVDISPPFDLVLAFKKMVESDNYQQLAWQVIHLDGDTTSVPITYEAQYGVATVNVEQGVVHFAGQLKRMELGNSIELVGAGTKIYFDNLKSLPGDVPDRAATIWVTNKTDKAQDIALVLCDPKSLKPEEPIFLIPQVAVDDVGKCRFHSILRAYSAQHYEVSQVTTDVQGTVKNSVDCTADFEINLEGIGDTNYKALLQPITQRKYLVEDK